MAKKTFSRSIRQIAVMLFTQSLFGSPQGEQVTQGDVHFTRDGSTTTIEAGHNSIIHYQSFSIAPGETVQFIQPDSNARVLNRVTGDIPSHIDGTLTANGQVYIANPYGIFLGKTALVTTNRLIAVAGNLSDQDFLQGSDHFTQLLGRVENQGQIVASAAVLAGRSVVNQGTIVTQNGLTALLAGEEVLLGENNGLVFARFPITDKPRDSNPTEYGIDMDGAIDAEGGRVLLAAGDIYGFAVRHAGTTRAKETTIDGMTDGVITIGGVLDCSNSSGLGGALHILGDFIAVDEAVLDVSGDAGGGTLLIGGDYQGKGSLKWAQQALIGETAQLYADAYTEGDGGLIVVWSDTLTEFSGKAYSRGGTQGGNGGTIETSSEKNLSVKGVARTNTLAPNGKTGIWLLDPADIIIQASGGDTSAHNVSYTDPLPAAINVSAINGAASSSTLQATNSITVNAAIVTSQDLTLEAAIGTGHITINQNITMNNDANLTLTAAAFIDAADSSFILIGNGGLSITGGSGPGTNTFNAASGSFNMFITQPAGINMVFSGNVTGFNAIQIKGNATNPGTNPTITFQGAVGTSGSPVQTLFVDPSNPYVNVVLQGGSYIGTALPTNNFGSYQLIGGATYSIASLAGTTGTTQVSINGTIHSDFVNISVPLVLSGTTTIDGFTGSPTGYIFGSTVTGGGNNLTVNAGTTAYVRFSGAISGINTLTIPNAVTGTGTGNVGCNFSTGGTLSVANLVTGSNNFQMSFNDTVAITNATTFNNTNGIVFGSVLRTYTFAGGLNTGSNSISASGTIATSNTAMTLGSIALAGATTFNSGTTGAITLGAITSATPQMLTITGGALSLQSIGTSGNPVGATSITASGGANISLNGNIYANGATSISGTGNLTLGTATTLSSTGMMTVGPNIVGGGNNLTITAGTGSSSFSGTISGVNTLTFLSNGTSLTFGGLVTVASLTPNGGSANFPIIFNGGFSVTNAMSWTSSSTLTFGGNNTSYIATGGFSASVPGGFFTTGNNIFLQATGQTITLTGPMTLGGNLGIIAATVNGSTSYNGNFGLVITVTTAYSNLSPIGNSTPLNTFMLDGGGTSTLSNNITAQGGTITINTPTVLAADIVLTDTGTTGITFGSTVDGAFTLTLVASNGAINLMGVVGGTTPLAGLSGNAALAIRAGNINTNGTGSASGGPVSLISSGSDVSVGTINTSSGNTGGVGGAITLQGGLGTHTGSAGPLDIRPNGVIYLNGNLTAQGQSGNGAVTLGGTRSQVLSVASIASSTMGNDVTITASTFSIGSGEVMTILGNLIVHATSAQIGDVNTLLNMTFDNGSGLGIPITLLLHGSGNVLNNQGMLIPENGMDLVAGQTFEFPGGTSFTTQGTGEPPGFFRTVPSSSDGVISSAGFSVISAGTLTINSFLFGSVVLDSTLNNPYNGLTTSEINARIMRNIATSSHYPAPPIQWVDLICYIFKEHWVPRWYSSFLNRTANPCPRMCFKSERI